MGGDHLLHATLSGTRPLTRAGDADAMQLHTLRGQQGAALATARLARYYEPARLLLWRELAQTLEHPGDAALVTEVAPEGQTLVTQHHGAFGVPRAMRKTP